MKNLIAPFFVLGVLLLSGCEKKVVLTLETKPTSVEIFAEDISLGITPIELTEKELNSLNLPLYERIETSPSSHWCTWDIGKKMGTVDVAHPDAPTNPITLRFTKPNEEDGNILISGFSEGSEHNETGKRISTAIMFHLDSSSSGQSQ